MAKKMEAHLHEESKLWSFVVLFQSQSRMQGGKIEESNMKKFKRIAAVGDISSTSWSSFYTYHISFRISGIQESNASNGVKIGSEMKKLWPFEDNRTKLSENFTAAKPLASTRVPLRKFKFCFRSCESSCEITSKLQNHKFNLWNLHKFHLNLRNPPV